MKIRIKYDGKFISVFVANSDCAKYKCFYPHHWITQAKYNNYTQVDKNYSCGTRDYRGCPDIKEVAEKEKGKRKGKRK